MIKSDDDDDDDDEREKIEGKKEKKRDQQTLFIADQKDKIAGVVMEGIVARCHVLDDL